MFHRKQDWISGGPADCRRNLSMSYPVRVHSSSKYGAKVCQRSDERVRPRDIISTCLALTHDDTSWGDQDRLTGHHQEPLQVAARHHRSILSIVISNDGTFETSPGYRYAGSLARRIRPAATTTGGLFYLHITCLAAGRSTTVTFPERVTTKAKSFGEVP